MIASLRIPTSAALVLVALPLACKSPDEYRESADDEVYEIIRTRRDELAASDGFTIDPPADSLRQRILLGEVGTEENPLESMTLVDALQIASETSRDFQDQRERMYLVALNLTLERWNFSVQEFGTLGALVDRANGVDTASGFGDLTVTKLFATGAQFIGNVGFDIVRDLSQGDGWDAVSNFSLNITQPLLRGFGRDIVTEPLTQAERDVLYEARSFERFRRTFAVRVATDFYRIVQLMVTLGNEERNYDRLVQIRERNEAFANAGRTSDIEVDQARQDELAALDRVVRARAALEDRLDVFKVVLGLPPEAQLQIDATEIDRLEQWIDLDIQVTEEQAIRFALDHRLDYYTAQDELVDAERKARVAADALRAGMDLDLEVSGVSDAGAPLDYSSDNISASARLTLDLPIERLPERNAFRTRLVALQAAERDSELLADVIVRDLRESRRSLDAQRESYAIQTGAVELAKSRVESSSLKLEAGRASTRDLLESQAALVAAENSSTRALIEYTLAGLDFYVDVELLRVSEEGIEIDPSLLGPVTPEEDDEP